MNLPNRITLVRICLIPLIVLLYLLPIPFGKLCAMIVLILACTTDFIDGHIARKNNLVTDLGKFLDPIADKVLTMTALLLVICDGTVPAPYGVLAGIIILGRELIISAFRQIAATKNFVMSADKWGKLKTITQDISLPSLFFLSFINADFVSVGKTFISEGFVNGFTLFNYILLSLAVLLTIVSGLNYLIKNWSVIK